MFKKKVHMWCWGMFFHYGVCYATRAMDTTDCEEGTLRKGGTSNPPCAASTHEATLLYLAVALVVILCDTYGIKCKPTSVKNPQANAILEHIHAVFTNMLCTAELKMAVLVNASDVDVSYQMLHGPFALPTIQC
jgi:hypothetical protein